MKKVHRGVAYVVNALDGRWEWIVYPKSVRFAGLEDSEEKATANAKTEIDGWLGNPA
jgi:hypothetical protein